MSSEENKGDLPRVSQEFPDQELQSDHIDQSHGSSFEQDPTPSTGLEASNPEYTSLTAQLEAREEGKRTPINRQRKKSIRRAERPKRVRTPSVQANSRCLPTRINYLTMRA